MSKKLLLADDSVTIQKVVALIFAHSEYELQSADNGEAALELARLTRPDIVLADVNMPKKDGYELCAAIKADPSLRKVPVLMLAGTFEPFEEEKARSVGADGWIAKPFESQALMDEVADLLARVPAAIPEEESPATLEPAGSEPSEMWTELGFDNLAPEIDGGEISPDEGSSWPEEELLVEESLEIETGAFDALPADEEPEPESEELMPAAEEDFLFIDESDLLEEEPAEEPFGPGSPSGFPSEPSLEEAGATDLESFVGAEADEFEPEAEGPEEASVQDTSGWPQEDEEPEAFRNEDFRDRPVPSVEIQAQETAVVAQPAEQPVPQAPAEAVIEQQVQALSEEQLDRIVERVAGAVIERLAGSILEKVAWEVVPDLAEAMIKEEIRKITEPS